MYVHCTCVCVCLIPFPSPPATARFSEAILDYLADEQRATEAGIRSADFEGEAYSIYELLFNVWLQSKESKVGMGRQSTGIVVKVVNRRV